jgi:hypothetical protein
MVVVCPFFGYVPRLLDVIGDAGVLDIFLEGAMEAVDLYVLSLLPH